MITENQKKDLSETGGLNNTKELIKEEISYFHTYRFPKDTKNYKQYLGFNIDRLSVIEDWQANISYPIGRSIIDTTFANMYDFGYEFGIVEKGFRKVLNSTFDYKGQGRKCLKSMIKEGLITGKSFCRTGIIKEEIDIELGMSIKIKEKVKKPTITYISKFNVFYDHNYSVSDSPYTIVRELLNGKAIKKKYKGYLNEDELKILDDMVREQSEINQHELDSKVGFSSFDFNPVKDIISYQNIFIDEIRKAKKTKSNKKTAMDYFSTSTITNMGILTGGQSKTDISLKNLFKYDNSKSYEVIEFEEEGKITLFVNGKKVCKYNSLLRGMGSIREIEFNQIPGTSESLGIMDIIGDLQSLLDSIWNSFIDNIKLQLTGMFKVKGNVGGLGSGKMKFNKFGILTIKGDSDIQRFEMGLGDFMPLNVVQYIEGFMSKMIGMNDYQLGGQHKVERVADGVDFMRSQYKSKLAVMIDSIQTLMSDIAREWVLIYLMHYDEEELKAIGLNVTLNEETKEHQINGVDIKNILNEENITFTYNALETIDMERDRERIMTLFQPLAQNGLVDQDELWNVALGKKFNNIFKQKQEQDVGADGKTIKDGIGDFGKELSTQVSNKYTDPNVVYDVDGNGVVNPTQPRYNSATLAKTPGGAKLKKVTHELNTGKITDRLSI